MINGLMDYDNSVTAETIQVQYSIYIIIIVLLLLSAVIWAPIIILYGLYSFKYSLYHAHKLFSRGRGQGKERVSFLSTQVLMIYRVL